MSKASIQFDLDDEHDRVIHDSAVNGWRYKAVLEELITLADGNTRAAIKRLAIKHQVPEIGALTGI